MKKFIIFLFVILLFSCARNVNLKHYNNYAFKMAKQDLYKEALFYLKKAESNKRLSNKEKVKLYNNIAICYEALGKKQKANRYYKKALKIKKHKTIKENYESFQKIQ